MKYLVTYEFENPNNAADRRGRVTEIVDFDGDALYRRHGGFSSLSEWFHDKELTGGGYKLIVLFAIRA